MMCVAAGRSCLGRCDTCHSRSRPDRKCQAFMPLLGPDCYFYPNVILTSSFSRRGCFILHCNLYLSWFNLTGKWLNVNLKWTWKLKIIKNTKKLHKNKTNLFNVKHYSLKRTVTCASSLTSRISFSASRPAVEDCPPKRPNHRPQSSHDAPGQG